MHEPSQTGNDQNTSGFWSRHQTLRAWWQRTRILFLIVLAATGLLPLLPVDIWWIRIGDFPRIQLLIAYVIVIGLLLISRRRRTQRGWILLLSACVMIQLYWIFPYLPIAPHEVETAKSEDVDRRLKILSANVLQDNTDYESLLKLVRNAEPDVLVVVEVNQRWVDALAPLTKIFPYHKIYPLENKYGIALYSQLELTSAEVRFMVSDQIPSIDAKLQIPSGAEVRLFAIHPNPPRPGEHTTKRDGELVLVGREVAASKGTAIVLGDLNDVGWSRTTNLFQEVSGMLDPRKGRGVYPTFNANSWIWRYPLDHLFHTEDFRVVELRTLPHIGSDHLPLWVTLSYEPDAEETQEPPDLDPGDREDADEAVEDAKAAVREEEANEVQRD